MKVDYMSKRNRFDFDMLVTEMEVFYEWIRYLKMFPFPMIVFTLQRKKVY